MAYNLGVTVSSLMYGMEYEELLGWQDYFTRRPLGHQEDRRAYMIMAAQGVKEKAGQLFPSLAAIEAEINKSKKDGKISMRELTSSVFFNKMTGSTDGDSINEILKGEL